MVERCPLCVGEDARPPSGAACVACERHVCSSHRWSMLGLCFACATEDEVRAHARAARRSARDVVALVKWID